MNRNIYTAAAIKQLRAPTPRKKKNKQEGGEGGGTSNGNVESNHKKKEPGGSAKGGGDSSSGSSSSSNRIVDRSISRWAQRALSLSSVFSNTSPSSRSLSRRGRQQEQNHRQQQQQQQQQLAVCGTVAREGGGGGGCEGTAVQVLQQQQQQRKPPSSPYAAEAAAAVAASWSYPSATAAAANAAGHHRRRFTSTPLSGESSSLTDEDRDEGGETAIEMVSLLLQDRRRRRAMAKAKVKTTRGGGFERDGGRRSGGGAFTTRSPILVKKKKGRCNNSRSIFHPSKKREEEEKNRDDKLLPLPDNIIEVEDEGVDGFNVLACLGGGREGDRDNDGVVPFDAPYSDRNATNVDDVCYCLLDQLDKTTEQRALVDTWGTMPSWELADAARATKKKNKGAGRATGDGATDGTDGSAIGSDELDEADGGGGESHRLGANNHPRDEEVLQQHLSRMEQDDADLDVVLQLVGDPPQGKLVPFVPVQRFSVDGSTEEDDAELNPEKQQSQDIAKKEDDAAAEAAAAEDKSERRGGVEEAGIAQFLATTMTTTTSDRAGPEGERGTAASASNKGGYLAFVDGSGGGTGSGSTNLVAFTPDRLRRKDASGNKKNYRRSGRKEDAGSGSSPVPVATKHKAQQQLLQQQQLATKIKTRGIVGSVKKKMTAKDQQQPAEIAKATKVASRDPPPIFVDWTGCLLRVKHGDSPESDLSREPYWSADNLEVDELSLRPIPAVARHEKIKKPRPNRGDPRAIKRRGFRNSAGSGTTSNSGYVGGSSMNLLIDTSTATPSSSVAVGGSPYRLYRNRNRHGSDATSGASPSQKPRRGIASGFNLTPTKRCDATADYDDTTALLCADNKKKSSSKKSGWFSPKTRKNGNGRLSDEGISPEN